MKLLLTIAVAAGAGFVGTDAPEASAPARAEVKGRVLFVGPLPELTGSVEFDGKPPEVKPLVIEAETAKGCVHEGEVDDTDRSLLIGEGGGVANVVVLIDVEGVQAEAPEQPIELDQKSCRFEPHVTVVPAGATVAFLNSDGVQHNVHTYTLKNKAFNRTIAPGGKDRQKLERADHIEIKCDIHPWMNSWLIVTDRPYWAITDASGAFTLPPLPAGTHTVEYWHEKLGKKKGELVVAEDGSAPPIALEWAMSKPGRGRRRK